MQPPQHHQPQQSPPLSVALFAKQRQEGPPEGGRWSPLSPATRIAQLSITETAAFALDGRSECRRVQRAPA